MLLFNHRSLCSAVGREGVVTGQDYFRGDQKAGITAPNLSKEGTYADHIVNARGKKTNFTSVSLDRGRIEHFGEADYLLLRTKVVDDGHSVVEHETLIKSLRDVAMKEKKGERLKALRALDYAQRRKEGLVQWQFDENKIDKKNVISWAYQAVQKYFQILP